MREPNDLVPRVRKCALASNDKAAKRGRSTAEFIAKHGVVVEEIDESDHMALAHAGLGHTDAAFARLSRACDERDPALAQVAVEPRFASLRADPRFSALLSQLRFPD